MSDADDTDQDAPAEEGKRKLSGKKLVLLYILPALLLIGAGGGAGAWFFLMRPAAVVEASAAEGGAGESKIDEPKELVFYDLPQILVNLNSGGKRNSYLKIALSLELC